MSNKRKVKSTLVIKTSGDGAFIDSEEKGPNGDPAANPADQPE